MESTGHCAKALRTSLLVWVGHGKRLGPVVLALGQAHPDFSDDARSRGSEGHPTGSIRSGALHPSQAQRHGAMLFAKLLPKEGNFF